jgi:hypothetical protein
LFALIAIVFLVVACGDGGSSELTPTSTPPAPTDPDATALPSDWPSGLSSLAEVDFSASPVVDELQRLANGGEVPPERVTLFDLIGDDEVVEAVVVVESGGTLGDIGVAVYELVAGQPRLVTFVAAAGRVELNPDLELLFTLEGVYEAGDAECCPSKLREVAYGWNGERFAVVSDQTIENPDQ